MLDLAHHQSSFQAHVLNLLSGEKQGNCWDKHLEKEEVKFPSSLRKMGGGGRASCISADLVIFSSLDSLLSTLLLLNLRFVNSLLSCMIN